MLFTSATTYAEDYVEIDTSVAVKRHYVDGPLILTIRSAVPYFRGFEYYSYYGAKKAELLFNDPNRLRVEFTPINGFSIEVRISKDQLEYFKTWQSLKFLFPDELIYTAQELEKREYVKNNYDPYDRYPNQDTRPLYVHPDEVARLSKYSTYRSDVERINFKFNYSTLHVSALLNAVAQYDKEQMEAERERNTPINRLKRFFD